MSITIRFSILSAVLCLAGCASHHPQGGTAEQYQTGSGAGSAEGYPAPIASPTFRPGMNPSDPRDSHFTTRPEPTQSPPNSQTVP